MELNDLSKKLLEEELNSVNAGIDPGDLPGDIVEEGESSELCTRCNSYVPCHYVLKIGPFGKSKHITGYCPVCEKNINYILVYPV